jgi:iron complex outermembrane receptor protein
MDKAFRILLVSSTMETVSSRRRKSTPVDMSQTTENQIQTPTRGAPMAWGRGRAQIGGGRDVAPALAVLLAGGCLFAEAASAQPQPQPDEVVVTGSRIVRDGFQAPTPVTVATADALKASSPTSISDGLNKLPVFVGSLGPNKTNNIFARPEHGNILNLRGLGPNRTLILFNGVRAPPTSYLNTVDVDIFPQLLVERVEVVTGGASASYGSDAVAGVVNYVLDTSFTGAKAEAQIGNTIDAGENERVGFAYGTAIGDSDRGRLLLSVEHYNNDGYLQRDRPELSDLGLAVGSVIGGSAPGTAANPYINVANARVAFATFGGVALTGPFANTNFVSPGVYAPINNGTRTGTGNVFVAPSDWMAQPGTTSASAALRNDNFFGRFSYDLSDTTTAYVQILEGESTVEYNSLPNLQAFPGPSIFSGNAFLPAALQGQLTTTNTPSFVLAKLLTEIGPITTEDVVKNHQQAVGVNGVLGRFTWKVDYTHSKSEDDVVQPNQLRMPEFYAAIDAVVNPATSAVVCRPTLSADPVIAARYSGCQPFNLLGFDASSAAARSYVTGTSRYRVTNTVDDLTANFATEVFSLPAGPMSVVFGLDYRQADLEVTSNADPARPPSFAGLRGVVAAQATHYYLTNQGIAAGSEEVTEVYAEFALPLLKDRRAARAFDLNGAVRRTDYSTSGSVDTWKIGTTWRPIDDLMFRATRSRDIRSATLFDQFAGAQTTQGAALDPHTGVNAGFTTVSSGNPGLKPELGDTLTAGIIYQPSAIRGLSISLDYYEIDVSGAIATLTPLAILQDCEASNGTAPSCANVQRPLPFSDRSAANIPISVRVSGINVAQLETDGLDLDVSYRTQFDAGGQFGVRAYITSVGKFATQLSALQPMIDYAGYNAAGSGGVSGAIPEFKAALSVDYRKGKFGVFVQENFIDSLKLGPTLRYVDPQVASFYTTDVTLTYRAGSEQNWELFATGSNIFDETPPIVYGTSTPGLSLSTIVGLYDHSGRAFVLGTRFNF